MKKVNPLAYRLRLTAEYPMHPIFNLEHLKRYSPSPASFGERTELPPTQYILHKEEYEVEAIMGHKLAGKRDSNQHLYLLRWKGYEPTEDSWVTENVLTNAPEIKLDGHLGRFNPTVNLQMYGIQPWYAFILQQLPDKGTLQEYPEHNALAAVWISAPHPAISTGQICSNHLYKLHQHNLSLEERIAKLQPLVQRKLVWWSLRPVDPLSNLIKSLRDLTMEFEDVVDLYTQITRGIKLKVAWLEFVDRKNHDAPWLMEKAKDHFMGVWVNTTQQDKVYWMIQQQVPTFIIHKISEMEMHLCADARQVNSFIADTDIERLAAKHSFLEYHANKWKKLLPPLPKDEWALTLDYLRWDLLNPNHFHYSLSRNYNLPGMIGCPAHGAEEDLTGGTLMEDFPSYQDN
ncbi:hypothetical protein DXG01_002194 [Tephrocybe rancida]|nr:hypothetical protein DXG01_002194 [Tephrocybe rancida]